MKNLSGKITISRIITGDSDDFIQIRIQDHESSVHICKIDMKLKDFARALTGLSCMNCDIVLYDTYDKAGMRLITKSVECPKAIGYNREDQKKNVYEDFERNYKDEWELLDDGTNSQQNGDNHGYVIRKYVKLAEMEED